MSATNRGGTRNSADFYPTPRRTIGQLIQQVDLPGGRWLECAAGDGRIIHVTNLLRDDIQWAATEIRPACEPGLTEIAPLGVRIGDFAQMDWGEEKFDVIVTNPPFSCVMAFLQAAMKIARKVVLLLRLNFLGSQVRNPFFQQHAPDVNVIPDRPYPDACEYGWFVWHSLEPRSRGDLQFLKHMDANEADALELRDRSRAIKELKSSRSQLSLL